MTKRVNKNFKNLRNKMSKEAQQRAHIKTNTMLKESKDNGKKETSN